MCCSVEGFIEMYLTLLALHTILHQFNFGSYLAQAWLEPNCIFEANQSAIMEKFAI